MKNQEPLHEQPHGLEPVQARQGHEELAHSHPGVAHDHGDHARHGHCHHEDISAEKST